MMKNKQIKREYETPKVEMMDARVERGFQGSVSDPESGTIESYGRSSHGQESNFLFN